MKGFAVSIIEMDIGNLQVMPLAEAIWQLSLLKLVRLEYVTQTVEEPKVLVERQRSLERRIRGLKEDAMALELSRLKSEAASDPTPEAKEQRRVARDAKIKELEEQLTPK